MGFPSFSYNMCIDDIEQGPCMRCFSFCFAVRMKRLNDDERPLKLGLDWLANGATNKQFILQENDTGEILVSAYHLDIIFLFY